MLGKPSSQVRADTVYSSRLAPAACKMTTNANANFQPRYEAGGNRNGGSLVERRECSRPRGCRTCPSPPRSQQPLLVVTLPILLRAIIVVVAGVPRLRLLKAFVGLTLAFAPPLPPLHMPLQSPPALLVRIRCRPRHNHHRNSHPFAAQLLALPIPACSPPPDRLRDSPTSATSRSGGELRRGTNGDTTKGRPPVDALGLYRRRDCPHVPDT